MPLFRQNSAAQVLHDPKLVVVENHPPGKVKKPDPPPKKVEPVVKKEAPPPKTDRSRRTSLVIDGRGANGEDVRAGGGSAIVGKDKDKGTQEGGIKRSSSKLFKHFKIGSSSSKDTSSSNPTSAPSSPVRPSKPPRSNSSTASSTISSSPAKTPTHEKAASAPSPAADVVTEAKAEAQQAKLEKAREALSGPEGAEDGHAMVEGSRMKETGLDERGESTLPSPRADARLLPSTTLTTESEPIPSTAAPNATPTTSSLAPPLPTNNLIISIPSSDQPPSASSSTTSQSIDAIISPTSPTSSGARSRSLFLNAVGGTTPSGTPQARRTLVGSVSGESIWTYGSDESSDEDDTMSEAGFVTPDEGLSEVGEEGEEEDSDSDLNPLPSRQTASSLPLSTTNTNANTDTLAPTHPASSSAPLESKQIPPPANPSAQQDRAPQAELLAPDQKRDVKGLLIPATQSRAVEVAPIPHSITRDAADKKRQAEWLTKDTEMAHRVMNMFLSSDISEAERIIKEGDAKRERLYYQGGDAILCTLKGMMTFEPADLQHALAVAKHTTDLASSLRKPQSSMTSRLSGLVKGGGGGSGSIGHIKAMTEIEKHAELVYAETLLMKAVLGIISGGEWTALIREAFNLRTGDGIYRSLNAYLEAQDAAAPGGYDTTINRHLRSGIELGTGVSSLMLSLLPGKVVKIAEVFGYKASRPYALSRLARSGGWTEESDQPAISATEEGVRRPCSDMILMVFHLVISSLVPVAGVDVKFAEKIMWWNLARYPNGVFTLFFQSRLHIIQCQPELSNQVLEKAIKAQSDYVQLQLIARWDRGVNDLSLHDFADAEVCFEQLYTASNWSKATYLYSKAVASLETGEFDPAAVLKDMETLPTTIRKVVGKSIPVEKFVARKARKYISQGRLAIPGLELAYVFGCLQHSPVYILEQRTLPRIQKLLDTLSESTPKTYGNGHEYYDDLVLGNLLKGVSLGLLAYPPEEAIVSKDDPIVKVDVAATSAEAFACLRVVLENGYNIELDHFLLFQAHFELGQLYEKSGDFKEALKHYNIVMDGKPAELNPNRKMTGKYSLQSGLTLKTSAALGGLRAKMK